jgi:hypothetical protein
VSIHLTYPCAVLTVDASETDTRTLTSRTIGENLIPIRDYQSDF